MDRDRLGRDWKVKMRNAVKFEVDFHNHRFNTQDTLHVRIEDVGMTFKTGPMEFIWHKDRPQEWERSTAVQLWGEYDNANWTGDHGGLFGWLVNDHVEYPSGLSSYFNGLHAMWEKGKVDEDEGKRVVELLFKWIDDVNESEPRRELEHYRNR